MPPSCFVGVDIQINRGCSFYVLDDDGNTLETGWVAVSKDAPFDAATALHDLVRSKLSEYSQGVAVGIDAPRCPLSGPREFFWDGKRGAWRKRKPTERGYGRHCEVAVKALKIANPQWTRPLADSPEWMKLGYAVFDAMPKNAAVYEVFPSASYNLLNRAGGVRVSIDFVNFARGPKDMLDACVAAMTVREFVEGRGFEIGGGDRLGSIVLPRPPEIGSKSRVLEWPSSTTLETA